MALLDAVEMGGIVRDVYGLTLIGVAAPVAVGCWYLLNQTKWGTLLKAVIFDREMGIAMGINVPLVYTMTFIGGAILGGLGGAYIAPTISVAPGLGTEVIVLSFAVVVVGGMGSIAGAAIGSVIIGILRAFAVHEFPQVELFVVFAVMAVVLVFRPEGLFAPPSRGRFSYVERQNFKICFDRWACDHSDGGNAAELGGKPVYVWFFTRVSNFRPDGFVADWVGLFGHAFYFGLGAYAVAIIDIQYGITDVFFEANGGCDGCRYCRISAWFYPEKLS